jgi:hypothetical protein
MVPRFVPLALVMLKPPVTQFVLATFSFDARYNY